MRDDGGVHPAELRRPSLPDGLVDYFNAYREIGETRGWSDTGPQPIKLADIESWMRLERITDYDEQRLFRRLIKRMDRVELDYIYEKSKK